jgi:hypothetical protein
MSNREDTNTMATTCTICEGNPNGCEYCGRPAEQAAPAVPAGVEAYADALGRQQWRAVGPNGTFLITRARHTWEIWRSDSLNTIARDRDLYRAAEVALYYANLAG